MLTRKPFGWESLNKQASLLYWYVAKYQWVTDYKEARQLLGGFSTSKNVTPGASSFTGVITRGEENVKAEERVDGMRSGKANKMKEKRRTKMIEVVSDFAASSSFPKMLRTHVIRSVLIRLHALTQHCWALNLSEHKGILLRWNNWNKPLVLYRHTVMKREICWILGISASIPL